MRLEDKIIRLRKQKNWSQEQLADELGVSRQAVSKWESGSSVPDLDKIIALSELFGVSTDSLIKDDGSFDNDFSERDEDTRFVKREDANTYLRQTKESAWKLSLAVAMCIISPVPLIILGGLSELENNISSNLAGGIGVSVLLVVITIAVVIFIAHGMKFSKYEFLEKEKIFIPSDLAITLRKEKEDFSPKYSFNIILGVALCIIAVIPLLIGASLDVEEFILIVLVGVLLVMLAIAVFLMVRAATVNEAYSKLLQEGDYTVENKTANKRTGVIATAYWCIVVAIYLYISFTNNNWGTSWIIWPVSGVLFGAVNAIAHGILGRK